MNSFFYMLPLSIAALFACSKSKNEPIAFGPGSSEAKPPVANTQGSIITSEARPFIQLDAGSTYDPAGLPITYEWKIVSGPAGAVIENPTAMRTRIYGYKQGTYSMILTATNPAKKAGTTSFGISVIPNQAPVARAGTDRIVDYPRNSVHLNAYGEDEHDSITNYLWRKITGPAGDALGSLDYGRVNITGLQEGIYEYELTVKDGMNFTGKDTVSVLVNGSKPPTDSLVIAGLNVLCPFGCSAILEDFPFYIPSGRSLRKVAIRANSNSGWKQIFNDPADADSYEINHRDLYIWLSNDKLTKIDVLLAWR
jgi:hypothetical protein